MTDLNATAFFRTAAAPNGWHQDPDHAHVSRGIELEPDGGWHPEAAHRILNGTATHDDILQHVDTDHVGHYWSTHDAADPASHDTPRSYAEPHEPIANWTHHAEPGENVLGAAGVVLVGHRPHGWNPDDNPSSGLMGNSYLPDRSHIPLHEIHYTGDGVTWHRLTPPAGTTVHTDGPPHTASASLQETASMDSDDYRMQHRAPGPEHAPLHNPTQPNGDGGAFRQDALDNPDWGEIGEPHEESLKAVRRSRGNPEAPVTIYRSVPHGVTSIRTGDWVSTSSQYALAHGMHPDDPSKDWPVLKATVPAKHVHTDGNDINEWGYNGPHIEHPAVHGSDEEWTEPTAHHTASLKVTEAQAVQMQHEAAAVDNGDGVMVALVPPREIAEALAVEGGQPVGDLHVTLAYLGNQADYTREQLKLLPQVVGAWAARHRPVSCRVGGIGKFNNSHKGQHVLWAAVDVPGGAQMHADLARYLEGHGYRLPSEHGWTPHMTLRYVDRHFRFMPHVDEHHWEATEVVTFVGGQRHPARLFGHPGTPTTL